MAGMRVASTDGSGWVVEVVDLALTGRRRVARCSAPGRPAPVGDGPQLCVTQHEYVIAYCADPEDLPALGVDLSRMAVVDRWLALGYSRGSRHPFPGGWREPLSFWRAQPAAGPASGPHPAPVSGQQ